MIKKIQAGQVVEFPEYEWELCGEDEVGITVGVYKVLSEYYFTDGDNIVCADVEFVTHHGWVMHYISYKHGPYIITNKRTKIAKTDIF